MCLHLRVLKQVKSVKEKEEERSFSRIQVFATVSIGATSLLPNSCVQSLRESPLRPLGRVVGYNQRTLPFENKFQRFLTNR